MPVHIQDVTKIREELNLLDQAFRLMGCKWDHARRRVVYLEPNELPHRDAPANYLGRSIFKIRIKGGSFMDFRPKPAQLQLLTAIFEDMALGLPVFILILKARQIGFSTMIALLLLALAILKPGLNTIVAAHVDKSASELFSIYKTAYDFLPDTLKPLKEKDNQTELKFDGNKSQLSAFVAKEGNMGVSTSYTHAHFSELALWKQEPAHTLATALDSIPKLVGVLVFAESTSRGRGNILYTLWKNASEAWANPANRGLNRPQPWRPMFFSWMDDETYYLPVDDSFKLTEEEQEFQARHRCTKQQLAWRRAKIAEKVGSMGEAGARAHFDRENPSTPEDAFKNAGDSVFNADAIEWLNKTFRREPNIKYSCYLLPDANYPHGYRPLITPDQNGHLRIYEMPKPDGKYLLCGDPTRNEGTDPDEAGAHIIDIENIKFVASYSKCLDPSDFGREMAALGWFFNYSFAGIESNEAGITACRVMYKELGYSRFYKHISINRGDGQESESLGFPLKGESRNDVIQNGKRFLHEYRVEIPDPQTLDEIESFKAIYDKVRNVYKPQAAGGKMDNLVMAALIGLYIGNQRYGWHKKQPKSRKLPREIKNALESDSDEGLIEFQREVLPRMENLLSD